MTMLSSIVSAFTALWLVQRAACNPKSRPYVAYRTSPFDQEIVSRRIMEDGAEQSSMEGGGRYDILFMKFCGNDFRSFEICAH